MRADLNQHIPDPSRNSGLLKVKYLWTHQSYDEVIKNFIVRQKEFQRVIDDILTTKDGSSFQHYVFVGRRGSGKSTLLRRIQAEISTNDNLNHKK